MKGQIIGGYRQNIAGGCQQTFKNEKFVDNAQQCLAKKWKQKIQMFTTPWGW